MQDDSRLAARAQSLEAEPENSRKMATAIKATRLLRCNQSEVNVREKLGWRSKERKGETSLPNNGVYTQ
ncbi:hypothetical protein GJAV_G00191890 [Gymnothorax javanicus]|nr:hypothetical protein GJAV_G00191890 [Gymnothorax javanicus]